MFGSKKNQPAQPPRANPLQIRDTLYGDLPLDAWPPAGAPPATAEPWVSFVRARESLAAGRTADAAAQWQGITNMPDLESRHYAQAWHFLRAHGVQPPPDRAKQLLGVVVEVPTNGGLDLLAAYPEHTARYYNYSGAGVVWERPNDSLDVHIDALLAGGDGILQVIGPWTEPRPGPPPDGHIRLTCLAPSGPHFGQAPFDVFANDPLAKPAVNAAINLMQQLIAVGGK